MNETKMTTQRNPVPIFRKLALATFPALALSLSGCHLTKATLSSIQSGERLSPPTELTKVSYQDEQFCEFEAGYEQGERRWTLLDLASTRGPAPQPQVSEQAREFKHELVLKRRRQDRGELNSYWVEREGEENRVFARIKTEQGPRVIRLRMEALKSSQESSSGDALGVVLTLPLVMAADVVFSPLYLIEAASH